MTNPEVTIKISAYQTVTGVLAEVNQMMAGTQTQAAATGGAMNTYSGTLENVVANKRTLTTAARGMTQTMGTMSYAIGDATGSMGGLAQGMHGATGIMYLLSSGTKGMAGLLSIGLVGAIGGATLAWGAYQEAMRGVNEKLIATVKSHDAYVANIPKGVSALNDDIQALKDDTAALDSWQHKLATIATTALVYPFEGAVGAAGFLKAAGASDKYAKSVNTASIANTEQKKQILGIMEDYDDYKTAIDASIAAKNDEIDTINYVAKAQARDKTKEETDRVTELGVEIDGLNLNLTAAKNHYTAWTKEVSDAVLCQEDLNPLIKTGTTLFYLSATAIQAEIKAVEDYVDATNIATTSTDKLNAAKAGTTVATSALSAAAAAAAIATQAQGNYTLSATEYAKFRTSANAQLAAGQITGTEYTSMMARVSQAAPTVRTATAAQGGGAYTGGGYTPSAAPSGFTGLVQVGAGVWQSARAQEGGIVTRPSLLLAGEGGEPEAVIPLSKLKAMLGNVGGGGTTIVKVYVDGREIAARVDRSLLRTVSPHAGE